MGRPSARDFFVHLYLNGVYWGLYDLSERPDAFFASTYYGGQEEQWDALNDNGVSNGSNTAWINYLNLCRQGLASNVGYQRVQGNNSDGTPNPALARYLDVDAMNDYLIALFWGGTRDWPAKNYWLLRHQTNNTGFQFMAWDTEASVGLLDTNATFNSTIFTNDLAEPYGWARANPEYRLRFADRVHLHFFNGGPLYIDPSNPAWDPAHPERNRPAARFAALSSQIESAMVAESARWGDQHRALPYTRPEVALRSLRALRPHLTGMLAVLDAEAVGPGLATPFADLEREYLQLVLEAHLKWLERTEKLLTKMASKPRTVARRRRR